ncbi:alpha/beta fold hydrolase [uncultured Campylobacter sp.]|uniref:alpha/beta fold hydrolase n=1 Tax=uncultured Campylobacter sp. TaxID=218934 RepID=UPI0026211902|nr:alpha/beta fold hydrolase [uncultured Campylobacter sp.]
MASKELVCGGESYKISYEISNLQRAEYILVLHGWGANKALMSRVFADKFRRYAIVCVDLPGFGASSQPAHALGSEDYAEIMRAFIAALGKQPEAIMGHSFGGKIAALLAPRNLILLSSAGIIEPKPFAVRAKIAIFKILKRLGLAGLWRAFASKDAAGMSEVMYGTLKNVVNEDFRDIFSALSPQNALIFWGKDDRATSLKSGELIHSLIKNSKFYPLTGDHFFFLQSADFIGEQIEKELSGS